MGLGIGVSNLLVWSGGGGWPGVVAMRMNTAVGITAAALSLAAWHIASPRGGMARAAQALGTLAALIGGLTAAQDLFGVDLRIDQLFAPATFSGDLGGAFTIHPGRMSLNAAVSLR